VYTPAEPLDDAPGDLDGNLSTVTDEEWRAAHERLFADLLNTAESNAHGDGGRLPRQFAYRWSPGEPA
jgi:hypothetical protein